MRGIKGIHGEHCGYTHDVYVGSTSSACMVSCTKFHGLIDMWMLVLCPTSKESTFHYLKCLEGKCDSYGIDMFITCPIEEEKSNNNWWHGSVMKKLYTGE